MMSRPQGRQPRSVRQVFRRRRWIQAMLLVIATCAALNIQEHFPSRPSVPPGVEKLLGLGLQSHYARWIVQDFTPWAERGISKDQVQAAWLHAQDPGNCEGGENTLRFQVVGGRLWVQHRPRLAAGWYPSEFGPGWLSAKGYLPFILFSLADTLRSFPGQVPDVDAVFQASDYPCVPQRKAGELLAPVLGFDSAPGQAEIPFPDFSYYGKELRALRGDGGEELQGWEAQLAFLTSKYAHTPLAGKRPQAVWRGRTDHETRDLLRRRFQQCPETLYNQGRDAAAYLFNVWEPAGLTLAGNCDYRFQVYLEALAWVTNLKQKLACGGVVLVCERRFYDFMQRALKPGVHLVEFSSGQDMCEDAAAKLQALTDFIDNNAGPAAAEGATSAAARPRTNASSASFEPGGGGGGGGGGEGAFWRHKAAAAAQAGGRSLASVLSWRRPRKFPWGSQLTPYDIARNAHRFLRDHLRMHDVRQYAADALRAYASLQLFAPQPMPGSYCLTGRLLLEVHFGFPHPEDADSIRRAYPWLESWDPGCPREQDIAVEGGGGIEKLKFQQAT